LEAEVFGKLYITTPSQNTVRKNFMALPAPNWSALDVENCFNAGRRSSPKLLKPIPQLSEG